MPACRDCQTEVSKSAKTCPKVGARKPKMSKVEWGFNRIGNTGLKVGLTVLLLGLWPFTAIPELSRASRGTSYLRRHPPSSS